jgi:tol-pal system protein YbgF
MRRMSLATLAVVGLSSSACFYPYERARLLEAKVERMDSEQATLLADVAEARRAVIETVPQVDRKLAEVTRALEQLDASSRRSGADIGIQMGKLVEDLAALTGQLDAQRHQLMELEAKLAEVEAQGGASLVAANSPEARAAAAERERLSKLRDQAAQAPAKELIEVGEAKAAEGAHGDARIFFSSFISRFPTDALLPRALLGLGQAYQAQDECRAALYEYQKVVQKHAKSPQAPIALLGSSDCFAKLGMTPESRLALETVVEDYPRSEAARTAKERLAASKPKR